MHYIIYKTTHIPTGMYYIGKHNQKLDDPTIFDGYFGSGTIIKKLNRTELSRETLFVLESEQEAYLKEQEIITKELLNDPLCLNLTTGGKNPVAQGKSSIAEGSVWMHSEILGINVRAKQKLVQEFLLKGFKYGRNKKLCKKISNGMKGLKWMHLQGTEKQVRSSDVEIFISQGWNFGRLSSFGKTLKSTELNKNGSVIIHKYENGVLSEKRVPRNTVEMYLNDSWFLGSISSRKSTSGKIVISNIDSQLVKYIFEEEFPVYKRKGWFKGNYKNGRHK